jgi:hypothetical protein
MTCPLSWSRSFMLFSASRVQTDKPSTFTCNIFLHSSVLPSGTTKRQNVYILKLCTTFSIRSLGCGLSGCCVAHSSGCIPPSNPEDGSSTILRNVGIQPKDDTMQQPKRQQSELTSQWNPQILTQAKWRPSQFPLLTSCDQITKGGMSRHVSRMGR